MSEPAPPPAPPRRSRFRRWTRRLLKTAVVLTLVVTVGTLGLRTYYRVVGKGELNAAVARLDAEDPGWRLADLVAAREQTRPADRDNSAPVVAAADALIPNAWRFVTQHRPERLPDDTRPYHRRLPADQLLTGPHDPGAMRLRGGQRLIDMKDEDWAALDDLVAATERARALALSLRDLPRGYRRVEFSDNPLDLNLAAVDGARRVATLLRDDALLAAHRGDPARALRAAHAALNAGRSIGDEPVAISQLVRAAVGIVAADAAARALGLTDPAAAARELADLQAALAAEADEPLLLTAVRADRAMWHAAFENIDNGKLVADVLARGGKMEDRSRTDRVGYWLVDAFLHRDHATFLDLSTKVVAAAKLPHHDRGEAMRRVESEVRALGGGWWGLPSWRSRLFLPATEKLTEATLRQRAALLTTATAIACERFRLARGRWPTSLDEIPKDVLPAVPADPFTGKPLTLTTFADGVAVCTVGGVTGKGSGGETPNTGPLGKSEIGCRLYDPEVRGLPPLPPNPKEIQP